MDIEASAGLSAELRAGVVLALLKAALSCLGAIILVFGVVSCAPEPSAQSADEGAGVEKGPGNANETQTSSARQSLPEAVVSVAGVDVDGTQVTASGYVTSVIAEGLRCTFSFVQGEHSIQAESLSLPDRDGSSCGTVQVALEEFDRGSWEVNLTVTGGSEQIAPGSAYMEVP